MFRNALETLGLRDVVRPVATLPIATAPQLVFIIDEQLDSRRAMSAALAGYSCEVKTAAGTEVSIETLRQAQPALILIDPQIIDVNGTQLASQLLADAQLMGTPVVALIMPTSPEDQARETFGVFDGMIVKPVQSETFTQQVQTFLKISLDVNSTQTADGKTREISRAEGTCLLQAIKAGLPGSQFAASTHRTLSELSKTLNGGLPSGLTELLKQTQRLANARTHRSRSQFSSAIRFCVELIDRDPDPNEEIAKLRIAYAYRRREELKNLRVAILNEDWASLATVGHNLKGTGAGYGFAEFTDLGRELESAANAVTARPPLQYFSGLSSTSA